jgi:membrane fusion protein, multidrug efflux system
MSYELPGRRFRTTTWVLAVSAIAVTALLVATRHSLPALESRGAPKTGTAAIAVPVLASTATAENVPIIVRGIGSVQAYNTVTVRSRVDGNIVKVGFAEGQYVHSGDLLFEIDPRPYQAQLEQAQANKAKDEANLENAKLNLARYARLLPTQLATTRQQYDTQKALVDQLTATVEADQAQIDAGKLNVAYCAVTSPIDGITGLRLVDIGNLVQASAATPLVVLTQIKPIFVTFTVPERDLDRIRRAMAEHPLPVLAFNGDDNRQLSAGVLKVVNNEVAQNTGTVTLKAEFGNADAALWPGEFVNAHLVLRVVEHGITVPSAAVLMGPSGPFVYRITTNATVEPIKVAIIQVENGRALVSGQGLAAGQQVVASGQAELAPGVKVAVKPGKIGEMNAREPEIGAEGVGSTGITTAPSGIKGVTPR